MSPWIAIRLRSRQVICITGSQPACNSSAETPRLDMWQLAPLPSVTLIASTWPRKYSSRAYTSAGSAESGGENSAVTANVPCASRASKPLPEAVAGAPHSGGGVCSPRARRIQLELPA